MTKNKEKTLLKIADKYFCIDSFKDGKSYTDTAVWNLEEALKETYEEGQKDINKKLLQSSLAHEIYGGKSEVIKTICKTLYEMGLTDSPEYSNSTAMCFEESNPTVEQMITVLNALGYEL